MQMAAMHTRVSSDRREAHTITSQTAALVEWAMTLDLEVPRDWIFADDGYSGATLERLGLERVREVAAAGDIQVVLVHSPDRLSRKYANQGLLIEEFGRHGVYLCLWRFWPPARTACGDRSYDDPVYLAAPVHLARVGIASRNRAPERRVLWENPRAGNNPTGRLIDSRSCVVEPLPPAGGGRPVGGRPRTDSAGSSESLNLCAELGQLHPRRAPVSCSGVRQGRVGN